MQYTMLSSSTISKKLNLEQGGGGGGMVGCTVRLAMNKAPTPDPCAGPGDNSSSNEI